MLRHALTLTDIAAPGGCCTEEREEVGWDKEDDKSDFDIDKKRPPSHESTNNFPAEVPTSRYSFPLSARLHHPQHVA